MVKGKSQERYAPRIRSDREYESPLGQYRVEAGLRVMELEKLSGVGIGTIGRLQNGTMSPVYEKSRGGVSVGSWKPDALKLTEVLGNILKENYQLRYPFDKDIPEVTVEDMFPRYACKVRRLEPTDEELNNASRSEYSMDARSAEEVYEGIERSSKIKGIVETSLMRRECTTQESNKRAFDILKQRFFYGKTLDEVGEKYNISKDRVRQIEKNSVNFLRNPRNAWELREFKNEGHIF